jgi:hypothetical protein
VLKTLLRNYSLVSTIPVSDACTVLESFTGFKDTMGELLTGANDTSGGTLAKYSNQRSEMTKIPNLSVPNVPQLH